MTCTAYRPTFFQDEKPRCAECGNPTPDSRCALCTACELRRDRDADFFLIPLPDDAETYGQSFRPRGKGRAEE